MIRYGPHGCSSAARKATQQTVAPKSNGNAPMLKLLPANSSQPRMSGSARSSMRSDADRDLLSEPFAF